MAPAMLVSSTSPALCCHGCVSFTCLRSSTSTKKIASRWPPRRARDTARSRRSSTRRRLGRPVSASCRASWRSCSSRARDAVTFSSETSRRSSASASIGEVRARTQTTEPSECSRRYSDGATGSPSSSRRLRATNADARSSWWTSASKTVSRSESQVRPTSRENASLTRTKVPSPRSSARPLGLASNSARKAWSMSGSGTAASVGAGTCATTGASSSTTSKLGLGDVGLDDLVLDGLGRGRLRRGRRGRGPRRLVRRPLDHGEARPRSAEQHVERLTRLAGHGVEQLDVAAAHEVQVRRGHAAGVGGREAVGDVVDRAHPAPPGPAVQPVGLVGPADRAVLVDLHQTCGVGGRRGHEVDVAETGHGRVGSGQPRGEAVRHGFDDARMSRIGAARSAMNAPSG